MDMKDIQGFATPSNQALSMTDEGIPRIVVDPVSASSESMPPPNEPDNDPVGKSPKKIANKNNSIFETLPEDEFDADAIDEKYFLAAQLRSIGVEPFPNAMQSPDDMMLDAPGNEGQNDDGRGLLDQGVQAAYKGASKGGAELFNSFALLAGAPVELAKNVINMGLDAVGMEPVKNAFGDIDSMRSLVNAYQTAVNDVIPVPDAAVEWASQPYDNEIFAGFVEAGTQFAVGAVPAAKLVKAMTTYNAAARGFIWGAIADFTAMSPDDPILADNITEYLQGLPPEEQLPILQSFVEVIAKNETDPEFVKRAKMALEGGAIGTVVEGAIRVAKFIPFNKIVDASKRAGGKMVDAADARIAERAADNSVTLTAGADPMPAVDSAISAAGRAVRPASAEDVLRAKYPNVELDVSENAKGLILSKIAVPDGQRSSGVGSAVMSDLVSYADSKGLPLAVTPDSTFGGSKGRLEDFYKRFGFVRNKGKNKDFAFRETFVRQPKTDPNQVAGAAMDAAQARYFETGKFEPPTADNPVSIVPPTETEPGIIAFHGSGADFDEFRLEMIGTGEGAQAYGYGLYFTQSEDIAKFYRDGVAFAQTLRGKSKINYKGKPFEDLGDTAAAEAAPPSYNAIMSIASQMQRLTGSFSKSDSAIINQAESAKLRVLKQLDADIEKYTKASEIPGAEGIVIGPNGPTLENLLVQDLKQQKQAVLDIDANDIELQLGKIYKVGLAPKPDELLDYDLPLSQQPKMLELIDDVHGDPEIIIQQAGLDPATATGGDFVKALGGIGQEQGAKAASEFLAKAGIPGIKFFSGNTRNTAGGKLIDVAETTDGFRAKVAVDNRAGGLGGSGRVVTTSQPYKTKQQALDWADEAIKNKESNYVIFDDKAVKILEKYGIVGPVAVTAAGVKSSEDQLIETEA